jgi:hypothetical protein
MIYIYIYIYEGLLPCSQKPSTHPLLHQINIYHAHHISWWSSLILFCHLCLGLTIGSFVQVSLQKPCMHFSSPHTCLTYVIFLTLDNPNNMWWVVQIMKFFFMLFPPVCYYVFPLKSWTFSSSPNSWSPWVCILPLMYTSITVNKHNNFLRIRVLFNRLGYMFRLNIKPSSGP